MYRAFQKFRISTLGLLGFVTLITGCPGMNPGNGNGNGNENGNDNGSNDNGGGFDSGTVTFGANQPDPADVEARPQAINPFAANVSAQLPPTADLTKDLPPIGDQGQLGSCTAWATGYSAATYSANRQFAWGPDTPGHQASPGYLYEKLLETDNFDCGSGTLITTAINILIQNGCSSLESVSYSDQVCSSNSPNDDAANFRIGSFNRVVETDTNAVRAELAAGRIVVIGARLYDDFPQATGPGVYTGSGMFLSQGNQHAAHAMSIVGYDDNRQAFRIMNSWSPQWGDGGFLWMHYDTFQATVFEAYSIEPGGDRQPPGPEPDPGPGPQPEDDPQAFLDEAYQFADVDPITRDQLVYLVFFYHFDRPVFIRGVSVTDPGGQSGQQIYDTWFINGYVYFVQSGGFQWTPGTYTLEFDVQTEGGRDILFTGEAIIEALDGGGGAGGNCSDLCLFAYDGECDDGGPGSQFDVCDLGTDCFDCGDRADDGGGTVDCSDTCRFAGDGECDDGRPGAITEACAPGTDCTDCGPLEDAGDDALCDDSCRFAFDGACDDGGPGAEFFVCEFGTDCSDCGPRLFDDLGDDFACNDTCDFAFDAECDDGRAGALTDLCLPGSDCTDCGILEFSVGGHRRSKTMQPGKTTRRFRGIEVVTPTHARNLPAAGVGPGTLGANRKPVSRAPRDRR